MTKNFSGAEIEGLVKSASSFALNRQIDPKNLTKPIDPDKVKITRGDFMCSLAEVQPAFGAEKTELTQCVSSGLVGYGPRFDGLVASARRFMTQLQQSDRTPLLSVLLEGQAGCGKTAIAAHLALTCDFPYIKLVSPDNLLGFGENSKCAKIQKTFDDAFKSPLSVVVVDEIERLLEYVPIGPRFSNAVLQTLLVVLKRPPPPGHKLLVIGTSSNKRVMDEMELTACFSTTLNVPVLSLPDEVATVLTGLNTFSEADVRAIAAAFKGDIGVKKLLLVAEMARQGEGAVLERFSMAAHEYGLRCFDSLRRK